MAKKKKVKKVKKIKPKKKPKKKVEVLDPRLSIKDINEHAEAIIKLIARRPSEL